MNWLADQLAACDIKKARRELSPGCAKTTMKEDSAPEQQDLVPAREELIEQTIEQQHLARRVDEVVVDDLETRVRIARPVEEPGCQVSSS